MKYCNRIVANLERKIQKINSDSKNVFEEIELGIFHSKKTLKTLRAKITTEGFLSPEDECLFFKTIKPKPLGYLIYYLMLANFQTSRPQNSNKMIKKHIENHIMLYQSYFMEHKAFYQYLERKRTDRDIEYFFRHNGIIKFHPDALSYCIDEGFSTSHDFIAAKIFAHKLLIERLNNELKNLNKPITTEAPSIASDMNWTGTKSDLIELIYALHETGSINNGSTDIKDLADLFQQVLNIDLGEYYRTYIEIRSRKINQTKFLDRMKKNLEKKMADADQ
ncbi:hypothetical protein LS48_01155 [Aequorivita aquimaris]|uniref:Tetracycline regulation of excision, RteC n=1 Tax=Aequorivita aquimaris TaxID=1548749 RepID=A0A137RLN8_9FLAO|nr:RteC domain-containing protein [Aequorivita aquimaris]KXO01113.1 hypothetical protein LS48_01155 [Aequorivita aquimaris]